MRKSTTQPLKDILREYIDALGHRQKLKETNIVARWEKLMGKTIARHTQRIFIKNKILYVQLDSSILRNELNMQREKILNLLNESVNETIINKIVLR